MSDSVDRHATFKTDPHSAQRSARFAGDRSSETDYAGGVDRRRDGRAFVDGDRDGVDGEIDQCSVIVRDGE